MIMSNQKHEEVKLTFIHARPRQTKPQHILNAKLKMYASIRLEEAILNEFSAIFQNKRCTEVAH